MIDASTNQRIGKRAPDDYMAEIRDELASAGGDLFDEVLASHLLPVGAASPIMTADFLGLMPAQCLMVAAHYSDLVAARDCGFRTAYVWRRREFGERPKDDLPARHDLDLVVEDFAELADRLDCA